MRERPVQTMTLRARIAVATGVAVLLAAVAVGYVRLAAARAPAPVAGAAHLTLAAGPRLLVVTDRRLATVSAADPAGAREVSAVSCVRAYAAGGTAVCLREDTAWSYRMVVLDRDLRDLTSVPLPGLPNRAQVSRSGRMVSWTTFVGGDSYTSEGFSTRTGILDTATGTQAASLETFAVHREGRPYQAVDLNFWGVTFASDDNTFYATLGTAGRRYLVQGDFAARTVRTLAENVECPSLAPDGRRVAFKQAIDGRPSDGWRLSVLDLATLEVTPTAETSNVDDQAAWLDGGTLGYTLRDSSGNPSIWTVPSDGSGTPRMLAADAESPSTLAAP
jgi:hypothetical protein